MTCPRPIRNAEPHPSPTDIVVPPFPIMEGSIVKPDELKSVMDRYIQDLMAGPLQHLMDVERVWDSVFRNVPGVGPLEIDNDPDSEHIGMVRDPEWPAFAGGLVVIGEIEDEVDTITMVLDGLTGAVDDLEEEMETQEACCTSNSACCDELTDRVEVLESLVFSCEDGYCRYQYVDSEWVFHSHTCDENLCPCAAAPENPPGSPSENDFWDEDCISA